MDLALSGALESCKCMERIVCAYDVSCQYEINLKQRMKEEFPELDVSIIEFLIGKMHCLCHVEKCQWCYNLHFRNNVGRMDGEAAERLWAELNQAAGSTKQMTPGHRDETLDDFFSHWNRVKLYKMGEMCL